MLIFYATNKLNDVYQFASIITSHNYDSLSKEQYSFRRAPEPSKLKDKGNSLNEDELRNDRIPQISFLLNKL